MIVREDKRFHEKVYILKLKNGMEVHMLPKDDPYFSTYVELSLPFGSNHLSYKIDDKEFIIVNQKNINQNNSENNGVSFLKDNECIGYGGLVHVNWQDMNAEVSLVLNTEFNENLFTKIGDVVRRALQSIGIKVKFNNGKDVYNFIKDYNRSIEKSKLTKAQTEAATKGIEGGLVQNSYHGFASEKPGP